MLFNADILFYFWKKTVFKPSLFTEKSAKHLFNIWDVFRFSVFLNLHLRPLCKYLRFYDSLKSNSRFSTSGDNKSAKDNYVYLTIFFKTKNPCAQRNRLKSKSMTTLWSYYLQREHWIKDNLSNDLRCGHLWLFVNIYDV